MRPLSSIYGKIKSLLITYPGTSKTSFVKTYKGLIDSLDDDVQIVFFGYKKVIAKGPDNKDLLKVKVGFVNEVYSLVDDIGLSARSNLVVIEPRLDYTNLCSKSERNSRHSQWAQDPFWVQKGKEIDLLIEPLDINDILKLRKPFADSFVADHLAASNKLNLGLKSTPYQLQGGNLQCGSFWTTDDTGKQVELPFMVMGNWDFENNVTREFVNAAELVGTVEKTMPTNLSISKRVNDNFKQLFGVDQLLYSPSIFSTSMRVMNGSAITNEQPFGHLDQYMNFAGTDPKTGKELVLIGDLEAGAAYFENTDGLMVPHPRVVASLNNTVAWFKQQTLADEEAFEVLRVPMVLMERSGVELLVTFNSCFVEHYADADGSLVKRVYLPRYSNDKDRVAIQYQKQLLSIEQDVEAFYLQQLGYDQVSFIEGDFTVKATKRGSLHCIAKVLDRTDH